MNTILKEAKEAFVSGHNGTTAVEVFLVLLSGPAGMLICVKLNELKWMISGFPSQKASIISEFSTVVLLIGISETEFLYPVGSILILSGILMSCCTHIMTWSKRKDYIHRKELEELIRPSFISWYRGLVILFTIFAILAVDFQIFPRRFAKTEYYGYSLMDLGAASYVFSSALVSTYAKK